VTSAFTPLAGTTAIEANAGTGKTFTITQLYVRLVLEAGLDVASILVVTYTRAATAELRNRLRERLAETRDVLARGETSDPFYAELLRRLPDRGGADRALRRALHGFDEAAVFTIHGFCQRVLAERAFESGVAFDAELVPDQEDLLLEVVDDFWRTTFYAASPMLVRYLVTKRHWTPEWLRDELRNYLGPRRARVIAPEDPGDLGPLEAAFEGAIHVVAAAWPRDRAHVVELLRRSPGLDRSRYQERTVERIVGAMDTFVGDGARTPALDEDIERLTARRLREATKAGRPTPDHPFFAACDALWAAGSALRQACDDRGAALRGRLIAYAARELDARKAERSIQFYDDLLAALARALADPVRGPHLAEAVRGRYRAALVDEFQDTDPAQYEIIRRLYEGTDLPVVLVGDPKQAIYSFRGADVFSYLRARAHASHTTQLDVNWRADPLLVRAVNALFGASPKPFLIDGISFVPSDAAPEPREATLTVEDGEDAPLRIWWLEGEGGKAIDKTAARRRVAGATADEIVRLLELGRNGRATRVSSQGSRPLDGRDIAVLVRTNEEGRSMREALLERGVPSVQQAVDSVFASREAAELERVLVAVANPGQGVLVRAALTTEMLGGTAAALERLADEDVAWEERVEAFHEYQNRWQTYGFVHMLRLLVVREGVAKRLLAFPDGERRVTNLFHLIELLHTHVSHHRSGIDALVEWLADQREAARLGELSPDEMLLRLESDAALVTIVTVHKAKGLQYPIVFCPFLWNGYLFAGKSDAVVCHEPDAEDPTLDLGSPAMAQRRERAKQEEIAERLRLLYVALTRAQHRCYLVWGKVNEGGTSPLAWLLHGGGGDVLAVVERYKNLSGDALRAEVDRVAVAARGAIAVEALPDDAVSARLAGADADRERLACLRLVHPVRPAWGIASFSALVAAGGERERPDYDQREVSPPGDAGDPRRGSHGFPRGARAGRCLHAILEAVDFTAPDWTAVPPVLRGFGIDDAWAPLVVEWMERVLATPLDGTDRVRLCDVPRTRRLDELEFYYPTAGFDVGALGRALADAGFAGGAFHGAAARLEVESLRGFLRGFVDCVFEHGGRYFVVDYKSNWLGERTEAYAAPALVPVVAAEQYWLQYLLYTLAVHRHLARRVRDYAYDRHMGGVRYLFLRGMEPSRGSAFGVYADLPSRRVIELLDRYVRGESP